jgi:nucleoside-diphosphate-sugar epimerase
MKILVTGAFGWTAVAIVKALKYAGHSVIAFDLPTASCSNEIRPLFDKVTRGPISDFEEFYNATQSVEAIFHLAVAIGEDAYKKPDHPFSVNVQGTYNVFESARRREIQKVVLMSEAAVHNLPSEGERLNAKTDWRSSQESDHLYDLTKRLQEEIARDYCETFGMNAVVLRAGHIVDGRMGVDPSDRSLSKLEYCRGGWVCRYDLAAACLKALELNTAGYTAFHIIGSAAARKHFDLERTETELGFTPAITFDQYP